MNVDMMDAEASSTAEAEIARKNGIKERMLAYQKEYQVVSTARRRAQFDVDWEHHERLKRNNWNPKCLRDMEGNILLLS